MTFAQYKRLLLVVTLPLLMVGSGLANSFWPFPGVDQILCPIGRWCATYAEPEVEEALDRMRSRAKTVLGDDTESFYVWLSDDKFRLGTYYIESVGTAIKGAKIVAYDYPAPGGNELAASWIGKTTTIMISLGSENTFYRDGSLWFLACNDLYILNDNGLYRASCKISDREGWGRFTFSSPRGDENQFVKLIENIEAEVSDGEFDRIIYIVLVYPSLLYGFLFLSGLVWLGKRAKAFVVAG